MIKIESIFLFFMNESLISAARTQDVHPAVPAKIRHCVKTVVPEPPAGLISCLLRIAEKYRGNKTITHPALQSAVLRTLEIRSAACPRTEPRLEGMFPSQNALAHASHMP